jgi:enoyl-CoA hydratase
VTAVVTTTSPPRSEHLVVDRVGAVVRVTLNRPERHNALSAAMVAGLLDVLGVVDRDSDVRVLVLRGAGRSFCSGYDVSAPTGASGAGNGTDAARSPMQKVQESVRDNRLFELLWRCPVPTIAQVHGNCLAAGTDLALACDLLVCAVDARVGYPAVRSMGSPATHMWLYHLGAQWTKRLLLTGDSLTGAAAARHGLALEAVEPDALDAHVLELAARLARVPRDLLAVNKSVVNHGLDLMGRTTLQQVAVTHEILGRVSPGADAFWATVAREGVRRAVAERDAPFAAHDPIP